MDGNGIKPPKRRPGRPRIDGTPIGSPPAVRPSGEQMALEAMASLEVKSRVFRNDLSKKQLASPVRVYRECRQIARLASPDMMKGLIKLATTSQDERVAYMSAVAVLDRAGVRPIDFDPDEETKALHRLPLEERKARLRELIDKAGELLAKRPSKRGLAD